MNRQVSLLWRGVALVRLVHVAKRRAYLTTDDVFDQTQLKYADIDPRMMGPVMQAAKRAGFIERTNVTAISKQKTNHSRPVAVWKSKLFN